MKTTKKPTLTDKDIVEAYKALGLNPNELLTEKEDENLKILLDKIIYEKKLASKQNKTIPLMSINDLAMSAALDNAKLKTKPVTLQLGLNFGEAGGKISKQLKAQGHKFDKKYIKDCEEIRIDILALLEIYILTQEEAKCAFQRLNDNIANCIAHATYGGMIKSIEKIK